MNKNYRAFLVLGAIVLLGFGGVYWWSKTRPENSERFYPQAHLKTLPAQEISDLERDGLLFMREEEKLAHDVYTALYQEWNIPIFKNIARSEETHTNAIAALLDKYGITDPAQETAAGVFVNPELQKLYTTLLNQGTQSRSDALRVGALIEDLDIADIQKRVGVTDNADVIFVYENLMKGSRNHLRSFTQQLSQEGVAYTPTYILEEEYTAIVNSPRETGPSRR